MSEYKPYSALGWVMEEFANRPPFNVRGPHRIAHYISERGWEFPTGQAVSKWFYGESTPQPRHIQTFAEVFGLSKEEEVRLAYALCFRKRSAA